VLSACLTGLGWTLSVFLFLFFALFLGSTSDELYSLTEYLSEPNMVQNAIHSLELLTADFRELGERLDMQARRQTERRGIAWDVRTSSSGPLARLGGRPRMSVLDVLRK